MKIGIVAAVDFCNKQPIGGILGYLDNAIQNFSADIDILGYTKYKSQVGSIVEIDKKVKIHNLFYYDIEKSKIPLRLVSMINYFRFINKIRKLNLNLFYFHSAEIVLPFIFLKRKTNKFVLHLHGGDIPTEISRFPFARNKIFSILWQVMQRIVFRYIDYFISIDENCEKLLARMKIQNRSYNLQNVVNDDNFRYTSDDALSVRNDFNIPLNANVLLYVGRIEEYKNINLFIKVLNELSNGNGNEWYGIIIGSGSQNDNLKNLASEIGVSKNIRWVATVKYRDLPKYYSMANIFFLPSQKEGVPMVLLEAFACGLPAVAINVGGIHKILHGHINGYLLNEMEISEKTIKEKILYVLNDKNITRETVRHSIKKYSSKTSIQSLETLFEKLMRGEVY